MLRAPPCRAVGSAGFHRRVRAGLALAGFLWCAAPVPAAVLWQDATARLIRESGDGTDLLHGAVKPHDDTSSDTLYFKFKATPLTDGVAKSSGGKYMAGMVCYEHGQARLGVGNAWVAWGYSAFNAFGQGVANNTPGEVDLASAYHEAERPGEYELPRASVSRVLVFKVQYVPGADDLVTAWLDPDLSAGSTETGQPANLVTQFRANASFDELRLIHRGAGDGWWFSELAVATAFEDFVTVPFWRRSWVLGSAVLALLVITAGTAQLIERRRTRLQVQRLERARALDQERARIAQDLHDDLGVRLTAISLLGDQGLRQAGGGGELAATFRKVSEVAREAVRTADGIVWGVNPLNDTLPHLANYLVQFAEEFFRLTPIRCRLDVPLQPPPRPLSSQQRHHIFLAVKEACHNAARHSGATEVSLRLNLEETMLVIRIEDNGRGFNPEAVAENGNGLRNLRERMAGVGGTVEFTTPPAGGTCLRLSVPLPPE